MLKDILKLKSSFFVFAYNRKRFKSIRKFSSNSMYLYNESECYFKWLQSRFKSKFAKCSFFKCKLCNYTTKSLKKMLIVHLKTDKKHKEKLFKLISKVNHLDISEFFKFIYGFYLVNRNDDDFKLNKIRFTKYLKSNFYRFKCCQIVYIIN